MQEQFTRQTMILGSDALCRLRESHVAVFGIGGVGSFCAEALARAGVGRLTLVDDDTVAPSNLNRQLIALHSTIGRPKVEVMAERITDINPDCQVNPMYLRYEEETKEAFFATEPDYIADAIDSVGAKLSLIETAIQRQVPIISSMGTGNKLDPTQFAITDIYKTSGCPLARVMRRELKKRGITQHTVLFSPEEPCRPDPDLQDGSRPVPGSVSWVPSCAGLIIAGHILRALIKRV